MELHLPRLCSVAIQTITDDRTVQAKAVRRMQPQLMSSAGKRHKFHTGLSGFSLQPAPPAYPDFAMYRIVDLIWPVV